MKISAFKRGLTVDVIDNFRSRLNLFIAPSKCRSTIDSANHTNLIGGCMANDIISTLILSDNDVSHLSSVVKATLHFHRNVPDHLKEYFYPLNTIAGLGYTATISSRNETMIDAYNGEIFRFMECSKDLALLSEGKIAAIADAISKMVQLALLAFKEIDLPPYFVDFKRFVRQICREQI